MLQSMLDYDPARFMVVGEDGELRVDWSKASENDIRQISQFRIGSDGTVKDIKLPDRARVVELAGKHIDVQAWQEKQLVEHQNAADIVARLQAGRKRAKRRD